MKATILDYFGIAGWLGFVTCLVIMLSYRGCEPAAERLVETSTIKIYDSTKKTPPPITLPALTYSFAVLVPADVDTAEILKRFFAVYTFSQTFQDSSFRAEIIDTISQNKIKGRKFTYQQLSPVKTIESNTTTITKETSGLFFGADVGTSGKYISAGPRVSYLTKKAVLVNAGYDVINKSVQFGIQFKINAGSNRKNK